MNVDRQTERFVGSRRHGLSDHEIDAAFCAVLDLEEGKRQAHLDRLDEDNPYLRRVVEQMLASAQSPDSLLRRGGAASGALLEQVEVAALESSGVDSSGLLLGRYRPVRQIGRGGMGVVYLVERADGHFDQRLALKLLPWGSGREAERRFARERRFLASLEHPNVARLIDGGLTAQGQPFLVMEYVDGQPIDRYCDEHGLDLGERLALLTTVCSAVQAAHQRLIVHRDLKPSNILVTSDGRVKLLDFGIAKLLDDSEAILTHTAGRAMTPQYASPEQLRGERITVASDVYQLGLLAYELLTGERPYDVSADSLSEADRRICEQVPEAPSVALKRRTGTGESAIAVRPGELDGDLDTVILKALRKEPGRRYGSVDQLGDDVESFLAGRPVSARPDTWRYRSGKFLRRNGYLVAAGVVGFVTIAALVALFTWRLAEERDQTRQAAQLTQAQRDRAEQLRGEAEEVSAFLVSLFEASSPYGDHPNDQPLTARDLLDRGSERIATEFENRPLVQARLDDAVGGIYKRLGEFDRSESHLRRSLALRDAAIGDHRLAIAESALELAGLLTDIDQRPEARQLVSRALAIRTAVLGDDHPEVALALSSMMRLDVRDGRRVEAVETSRRVLEIFENLEPLDESKLAWALSSLARSLMMIGKVEEAKPYIERAMEIHRRLYGPESLFVADSMTELAFVHGARGEFEEASELYGRALKISELRYGVDNSLLAPILGNYSDALAWDGRLEEACAMAERLLRIEIETHGESHRFVAFDYANLAWIRARMGDLVEAEADARRAIAIQEANMAPGDSSRANGLGALADVLRRRGAFAEADELLQQALDLTEAAYGPHDEALTHWLVSHAIVLDELGESALAERSFRRSIDSLSREHVSDSPQLSEAIDAYAEFLRSAGREREAAAIESARRLPE